MDTVSLPLHPPSRGEREGGGGERGRGSEVNKCVNLGLL